MREGNIHLENVTNLVVKEMQTKKRVKTEDISGAVFCSKTLIWASENMGCH